MTVKTLKRRDFIKRSLGSAATVPLWLSVCQSQPAKLESKQGFQIGACDWTLGKSADPEALAVARQIGLDGVQVSLGTVEKGMHLTQTSIQQAYRDAEKRHGVKVGSLAIGALNQVPYKSDPRTETWVSDSVDVCQALGVKVVLLAFFGKGDLRDDPAGVQEVLRRLKAVAPKAEKAGVSLAIESWLSAEAHMDIIQAVGSPAVKVYYDVGNSHKRGYDIYREIRFLGKAICEFHAKDYQDLYGKGSIDFPRVREAMDDIGYRGWLHMEGTKFPLGREESLRYDVDYLRTVFPSQVS